MLMIIDLLKKFFYKSEIFHAKKRKKRKIIYFEKYNDKRKATTITRQTIVQQNANKLEK